jgi:hypothetical protein
VAPENMRSLRGLLKEGFTVRRYAIVYGGLARLVVQRDLLLPVPQPVEAKVHVAAADHEGHQRALAEGLQGYHCWQDAAQQWFVDYA